MINQFRELLNHPFFANTNERFRYDLSESDKSHIEVVKQLGFEPIFSKDELNDCHFEAACWFYNSEKNLFLVVKFGGIKIYPIKTFEDLTGFSVMCPKGTDLRAFIKTDNIMSELSKVAEAMVERASKDVVKSITCKLYDECETLVIDITFTGESNCRETVKIRYFNEGDRFEYAVFNSDNFGTRSSIEVNLTLVAVLNRLHYLEQRLCDTEIPF